MKRIFTLFCATILLVGGTFAHTSQMSAQFAKKHFSPMPSHVAAAQANTTAQIGPVDGYGFMQSPTGATWTYTAAYTFENNHISGVNIDVYDESNTLIGKLNEVFELEETDLWVNNISISPVVTKKFFNFDNNIEVMLFVYVATKNYQGRYFNNVYSLSTEGSSLVCTLNGNLVAAENLSTNPNNDNFVMAFYRDGAVKDEVTGTTQYCYSYDIYEKAGYGTNGPKLVKTFDVPYDNIKALNDPMPLIMVPAGGKMNYFVAQYEKPYFVPETYGQPEPEVTADNKFVITQYDNKFNVLGETKIAMEKDPDKRFLYTFYYLGSLSGKDDVIMDYNGTGKPAFVVTLDNYETSSDASVNSYYLYDSEGNQINAIAEHTLGTIYLSDVVGQPTQYAFLTNEDEVEAIRFVDVPSCELVTEIALYNGGDLLSNNVDRVAKGDTYQYVITLLQGNGQADGTTVQRVAWFDTNGDLDHYDNLNLGQNVDYAQIYIYAPVLNPRLFHTDDAYEYMALLKRNQAGTTVKEEVLLICNNQGEAILEMGADPEKGGNLNMIDVVNIASNPTLVCTYSDGSAYTIHYTALPLAKTQMKGDGSATNPYQITCVSDFMQIDDNPSANYLVMNDIDFSIAPFVSLEEPFMGKLDGGNHTFKNIVLEDGGLFNEAYDTVVIKNLYIENSVLILEAGDPNAGFIVNSARGGVNAAEVQLPALISNVHLINPIIEAETYTNTVGGLVGEASLYVEFAGCSVKEADFNAPKAESVGGIAGKLLTSSFIHASSFTGTIQAGNIVGGIAGTINSSEKIYDCHVDANILGTKTIGGIVGESGRAPIYNCYAEGTLALDATATEGEVGGILGHLAGDATATDETMRIENCLVNIAAINLPENAENIIAHRIVGFTYVDDYEYDWDNVDWSKPQDEWPKIYGVTETCIKENYVLSALNVLDNTIAAEHTTTEGADLALEDLTNEWLAAHQFALGTTVATPWVLADGELYLWLEESGPTTGVENVGTTPIISYENGILSADGVISVYNLNGMMVAQGENALSAAHLSAGVYVLSVSNNEGSQVGKILIR